MELNLLIHEWRIPGSNRSPLTCHASALPDELIPHWPPPAKSGAATAGEVLRLYFIA
jgi:hypothetical protein